MLFLWVVVFAVSLAVLVKGADWFVESSEKMGLALKISPFIIGVTIVAVGTSFPELAASLAAVFKGAGEIVAANVIGSNIFNILVVVGLSAVAAGRLIVKRSLIDLDLPLLAAATALFLAVMADQLISTVEGFLLLAGFGVYLLYTIFQRKDEGLTPELAEILPSGVKVEVLPFRVDRRRKTKKQEFLGWKTFFFWFLGLGFLIAGANYTIDSLVNISSILDISPALMAAVALAAGTSLPEVAVSVKAASQKKYEIALGNIFGSNVFNALMVAGLPAVIQPLTVDGSTFAIGLPVLMMATILFVISGISRRIHIWEGLMYLLLYFVFATKLFGFL